MDTVRGAAGTPWPVEPHNPLDHSEPHRGACYHPNQAHPVPIAQIVDAEVVEDYHPRHAAPESDDPDERIAERLRSHRGHVGRHRAE